MDRKISYKTFDKRDHKPIKISVGIARIILTPIFLLVRIYCWVWDYDYYDRFKR